MKRTANCLLDVRPRPALSACGFVVTLALSAVLTGPAAGTIAPPGNAEKTAHTPQQAERPYLPDAEFTYIIGTRKDPFMPFITEKATTTAEVNMNEIIDVDAAKLTGMQLFEAGQLTLVALMKSGSRDFAMVQDFTGKGYVINKGTKIGKRGVVVDITSNKVVIEETAQTRAGQKIVTNTVMVLKKEGEE
ncbi:MAG: pilus assembly protein PilP [Desulfopila sp.]